MVKIFTMNTLKDIKEVNDIFVFVSFHLTDDVETGNNRQKLSKTMEDNFGQLQSEELITKNVGSQEVIYRIQKPIIPSYLESQLFFERLEKVFQKESIHTPHFTQVNENTDLNKGL